MKSRISFIFFISVLFFSQNTFAQEHESLISGTFHEVTFNEFVQKVEAQSDYHFFYDASQFDSISITITVTSAHLQSVLDKIFSNTNWHYLIDKANHVFVTKGFVLS
ncbi:MAG TPA: hypothetical protein VLI68_02435, partial [Hanamia sp.]|nr:hypothetical protein [Hanamia sp.]